MKLRIKGDSIRLRLTQGEVHALEQQGVVEDRARFGAGATLVYRLTRDRRTPAVAATYADGVLEVRLPEEAALNWCRSNEVGLTGTQQAAPDAQLRIAVEKDFACLTAREGEDESDNFPNPRQSC
ncbi:MAG TPA: hypothetical protein VFS52_01145 [Steroidobacteraceae bacterium]|jgi:hypothetical protein|nr:hypothetical protein [Steroidobacteraceae bacterium]